MNWAKAFNFLPKKEEYRFIFFRVADMISFALLNNRSEIFDVGDSCFTDPFSDISLNYLL